MPVDPTDVAGKRIAAWFIDAVVFVIIFGILTGVAGLGPTATEVSADRIRAATSTAPGAEPTTDDIVTFCNDWNRDHGGWGSGICMPNMAGLEAEDGAATIVGDFGGMAWLFGALVVVFIVYQGLAGASLGKLALGLRIVKADGTRAGIGASAVRTVLWIVDGITCALPIVGGILILATREHRRVGDMAAGTYVVPAAQVGHPVIVPGVHGAHPPFGGPPAASGPWTHPTGPGAPHGVPVGPGTGSAVPGAASPGTDPWAPPPTGDPGAASPGAFPPATGTGSGDDDYEADQPIWDDARQAYIQYDSARAAWLEFDDKRQKWGPIST